MQGPESVTLKTCSIDMRFNPDRLPRALELLLSAAGPIRAKRGCRTSRVERDAAEEGLVHYAEEWETEGAFVRHVRSDEFWRVLLAMDLCAEEPEVTIGDLSARRGMEALRRLRASPEEDGAGDIHDPAGTNGR